MKKRRPPTVPGWLRHGVFECRVDSRGRITLPSVVREYMHLEAGDKIQFTMHSMCETGLGSAVPDQYYAVLNRMRKAVAPDVDLEF